MTQTERNMDSLSNKYTDLGCDLRGVLTCLVNTLPPGGIFLVSDRHAKYPIPASKQFVIHYMLVAP